MRRRINTECGLMTAFSSHPSHQHSKMRVLIVCATILVYVNAAPSHLVPLASLGVRTIAYPAVIPTISAGDIQGAAIDAHVKYADLAQAAVDKARQISEQAVEGLNVNAYSSVALNQAKVTDTFWENEDKKWQTLDVIKTAEAQSDGVLASSDPILAKTAALDHDVAAVSPNSAVTSYSALPTISSVDIQPAAIDAQVKYADLVQVAVDKARQISETAQAQLDSAYISNTDILAKSAFVSPYVAAVAHIKPVAYSGFIVPATTSISNQFLVQSHPATSKAEAGVSAAEASVKSDETSIKDAEFSGKTADASVKPVESEKSEIEKSIKSAITTTNSAEPENSEFEKSMKLVETSVNSAESGIIENEKSIKTADANINYAESEKSENEQSAKISETGIISAQSEISENEKSVKIAEAALKTAKLEADKAFAALQSALVAQTGDLSNAYLIPNVYSSVALGQPILHPLQPIAPVVGQTYLNTLC